MWPASTESAPVFSNNTLLSVRCHTGTASPLDKVWELQVVPFFMAPWRQVATDLLADQSLLRNLHCRFCCIAVVKSGNSTPTVRKPLVTPVKSCLSVICYCLWYRLGGFKGGIVQHNVSGVGKTLSVTEPSLLLRMLHACYIPACLFLAPLKKHIGFKLLRKVCQGATTCVTAT